MRGESRRSDVDRLNGACNLDAMPDLHEARGPKTPRSSTALTMVGFAMICASFFVQGFDGPRWVDRALILGAMAVLFAGIWLDVRARPHR